MSDWFDDPIKKTRFGCALMCAVFMAGVIVATVLSSLLRRLGSCTDVDGQRTQRLASTTGANSGCGRIVRSRGQNVND